MELLNIGETRTASEWRAGPAADGTRGVWTTGAVAMGMFGMAAALLLLGGCAGRPTLFPNADPALRKTAAEFAADGARRHPYNAAAPRGGEAAARAGIDYSLDLIQLTNLSDEDWTNVEVWVNGNWVVFLPKLEGGAKKIKTINFTMLYDEQGHSFPTWNVDKRNRVQKLELFRDGKWYDVRLALAD